MPHPDGRRIYTASCGSRTKWPSERRTRLYYGSDVKKIQILRNPHLLKHLKCISLKSKWLLDLEKKNDFPWFFYQKYLIYQSSQGQVHPLLMNDLMTRMRMKDLKQDLMVVNELKIVINSWLNPKYGGSDDLFFMALRHFWVQENIFLKNIWCQLFLKCLFSIVNHYLALSSWRKSSVEWVFDFRPLSVWPLFDPSAFSFAVTLTEDRLILAIETKND